MAFRSKKKSIAVIGAGQCGLVTMKILAENGYSVHTYEINEDIGGLWNYGANKTNQAHAYEPSSDNTSAPLATSYATLRMNTSVWSSVYSDFPPHEGMYDEFFTHAQYTEYLKKYAKRFRLHKDIEFNAMVVRLDRVCSPTPGWMVQYKKNGELCERHFNYVVVCSGAFNYQKIPNVPGLYDFSGLVIQSNQIRDPAPIFKDKVVLVLGGSVTGADLACNALKSSAKKVYLSASSRPTERNRWFLDRYPDGSPKQGQISIPWDMQISRNIYAQSDMKYFRTFQHFMQPFVLQNTEKPATEPTYGVDAWMVADTRTLKTELQSQRLQLINVITEIHPTQVNLKDGTSIQDIDVIVIATGFKKRFPFLDHIWSEAAQSKFELYNHIVPLQESLDGIAFTGLTGAPIGVFVVAEMQARWLAKEWHARTYSADTNLLYSTEKRLSMTENIRYLKSVSLTPYNYIADPYTYLDNLAKFIGCMPLGLATDFTSALEHAKSMRDIQLAVAVYHGPFIACHYRLSDENPKIQKMAGETAIMVARKYLGQRFEDYVHYYSDCKIKINVMSEREK